MTRTLSVFNRIVSAIIFMAVGVMSAWANGNIKGVVISKDTETPIDFAMVQLFDAKTDKGLAHVAHTDESGNFILENIPNGHYLVKVSSVGSVGQARHAQVNDGDVNVGVIKLADDAKLLKEVTVEGVRGQMKFELDKKVFNVDSNIAAAGASASELLESIPSVEVDQDGGVSLRGNSSVTVWINGKESGLTADNQGQILEQIPAESIEKIEVITNPSAKYSPEGTAGIINIVMKKDRRGGYFGSAEIGGNSQGGANASVNINYNTSKWETYASLGFRMRHNKGGSRSRRDYDNGDFLYSDGDSRNHGNNLFVRLGATFHASKKDDIYANAFGMFGHRWGHSTTIYSSNLPNHWLSNDNTSRNNGDMRGAHGELGYIHRWSDTHSIDIMAGYNYWGGPSWNSYLQRQTYVDDLEETVYREQDMEMGVNNAEVKIDYTNQLTSWLKLEAGFNGQYNRENSPVSTMRGTSVDDLAIDPALYNRFIYDNDINALYVTVGGKVKNFSFSAGLRGEYWQIRARSLEYEQTESDVPQFKRDNFALFPSAFLSYQLPMNNEVQVNYTRRIRRPWGGQLNSFRNISDPTNISYGNPELESQYSHACELNYIKSWTYHMISLSAYIRSSENDINRISYLDGSTMYSTFANVGTHTDMGCEIVAKNNLFGRLDLTTTVNLYNNHQPAWSLAFENNGQTFPVSGEARNNFAWDARMMASVRLPWGLSFQATGRYNSRNITAQGTREAGWSVDAGIRKVVGNWSISLNCRDIFDSRKWHTTTAGVGYTQDDERWRGGRRIQLSVRYSFGNMKQKPSKKAMQNSSEPMDGSGYGDMDM